jgi:phage shock protein A
MVFRRKLYGNPAHRDSRRNRSFIPSRRVVMSIIDRIRRIAQANINSLLDKADTPEMVLQDKIEELEKTIGEAKEALAGFAVSRKRLEMEQAQSERAVMDWTQRAEQELKNGKESAARNALTHRIRSRERAGRLRGMLDQSRKIYEELKENLVVLSDQLRAARLSLSELRTRKTAAEAQKAFGSKLDKAMAVSGRDINFSPFEEEVLQAEMEVDIDREVRADMAAIDKEIEQQKVDSVVNSELDALKKKLGQAG